MLKVDSSSGVVIWAIDPFEGKIKPHHLEVESLLAWLDRIKAQIQPVYILNLKVSNLPDFESSNLVVEEKKKMIEKSIETYLQDIGCGNTLVPKVLVTYDSPLNDLAESFVRYSVEIDAELIIVSSRGRKGFDRFISGSFAEAILFKSVRPLYFLTHQNGTPTVKRTNSVLFPTDFSAQSKKAFQFFLNSASRTGSEIILYYAVSIPPTSLGADGMIVIPDSYCAKLEEDATKEANLWIKEALVLGVKVKHIIHNTGVTSNIASDIVETAKQNSIRFIAMASNNGKVKSIFFGSVAREVFRANLFPVWICGPQLLPINQNLKTPRFG